MAIAFHSNDRIWIIDAEADVGEAVEEGIKKFWDKGIRDARVRERHCREIRLKGDPCEFLSFLISLFGEIEGADRRDEPQYKFVDLIQNHPPGYFKTYNTHGQRL